MRIRSIAFAGAALAMAGLASAPAYAQVKAGGEFRANTTTSGVQAVPFVAMQGNGDFIVTWISDDGDGYGVFGQRYARDGSSKGGEFLINTTTAGSQRFGHVAIGRAGQFVVVWRAPDGVYDGIFGQRFDAGGARVGGEFAVNTDTAGTQYYGNVAMDGKGNFVVAWASDYADGQYDYGVRAQRFDASANRLGSEFSVNATTYSYQGTPKLAAAADGRFVVVWQSYGQDGSYLGVFGQRFDANGVRAGGEFQVNAYSTSNQGLPEVGMTPDGSFVVGWRSYEGAAGLEVRAQRYDASGNAVGANFAVNSSVGGNQFPYSIAVDNRGNYVMAWDDFARDGDDYGSFGWRVSSTDTRRGAEFQANSFTTGYQGISQVAGDDVGNFVVAWHSDQDPPDANLGIYAQRYGGLFPNALVVDGAGNLVWEPGETVVVSPAWRNLNGASQTFGGTLVSLTGPAGATYTITDPTAVYGTVANGASAPCTDCYGVSVNNPTTRPVQHWDVTGVESITPDSMGQQKGWLLHIGRSFADVSTGNGFYRFVETLLHKGVTGGCGGGNYCPGTPTTRDQMSVFVLVAKEGAGYTPAACTTPVFNDVPASNGFCRFIEELFRRGVVSGCGGGNYCPGDPVTREQMSIFTLRTLDPALNPPACGTPMFNDVPATSPFCKWIEELARRGVVTGCGGGNYCPTQSVTRDQMGVFISVTFGLTLYGV